MLGYLDDWYGTPQTEDIPPYNIKAVRQSATYKLLSTSQEKNTERITRLRQGTIINCTANKNTGNPCLPFERPCLFNIEKDPCENNNLYGKRSVLKIQRELEAKLHAFRISQVKVPKTFPNKYSNPARYNNTWVNWGDFENYTSS